VALPRSKPHPQLTVIEHRTSWRRRILGENFSQDIDFDATATLQNGAPPSGGTLITDPRATGNPPRSCDQLRTVFRQAAAFPLQCDYRSHFVDLCWNAASLIPRLAASIISLATSCSKIVR